MLEVTVIVEVPAVTVAAYSVLALLPWIVLVCQYSVRDCSADIAGTHGSDGSLTADGLWSKVQTGAGTGHTRSNSSILICLDGQ